MFEKIVQNVLSLIFVISGAFYIFCGGPEGQLLPIPEVVAPLSYRLLLGSAFIVVGAMAYIEVRSKNKENKNNK